MIDRTYTMRTGLARGLRKRGGLGIRQTLGLWESEIPQEDAFLQGLDLTGATVYDVGAFEGIHAIFFASRVGPDGRVVSFEPIPENRERIAGNVCANHFQRRIEIRPQAVADSPGELDFALLDSDRGVTSADPEIAAELASQGARQVTVEVTTVDEVVAAGVPAPDFVKIDVEGLELAVLRGAAGTLRDHRPRLFIELHGTDDADKRENATAVAALLLDAGYRVHHVEEDAEVADSALTPARGHLYAIADPGA